MKQKIPVSADSTLFSVASISKLFTWTAVMQLVEQGKLDLDADVNQYLDFKIPSRYQQPITIRDLMIHRSGFEEVLKDLLVTSPKDIQPFEIYIKTHLPKRIFPPGSTPAYSNYGAA